MAMNPQGYLDLGSNTFQLLIARPWRAEQNIGNGVLYREERPVLVRKGIRPDKSLSPDTLKRAHSVLRHYAAIIRRHGVTDIHAVATEVFRTHPATCHILHIAEKTVGTTPHIISGTAEARLGALAARYEFPHLHRCWTMDIGGGSTELSLLETGRVCFARSLPLGSSHLVARFPAMQQPPIPAALEHEVIEHIRQYRHGFPHPEKTPLIGLGGFFQTLAKCTGSRVLSLSDLRQWHRTFMTTPLHRWEGKNIPSFRIPLLPISSLLTMAFMAHTTAPTLHCASGSLKEGLWIARHVDPAFFRRIFQ